ncbi:unnamed protein product [Brassicogethes aeneus]|uniref:DUF155 domain-containing protein n=1 Tax=Brassicogethes aeneus TaxID=1431903 RepID=A0A9P0AVW2_BRAAE|nr:unnamed protein product [Brassicogethes aeneus]
MLFKKLTITLFNTGKGYGFFNQSRFVHFNLKNNGLSFLQNDVMKFRHNTVKHLQIYNFANQSNDNLSSMQIKKRPVRKKKSIEVDKDVSGLFNVVAYATSEEYNLEALLEGLRKQDLYEPRLIENTEVVHAVAKIKVDNESREIFFFKEGSVVLWNVTDLESSNLLAFLKKYQQDSYSEKMVQSESEIMNYKYQLGESKASSLDKDGNFILSLEKDSITLDKYTFSNAMVLSVKLGIWEAFLDKYIDTIESVTEDLKFGKKIQMTREEVLRKHGELFALRHYLNLSSDVLDTPDFYWENEHLENLYNQVSSYFCINKRTKVMNEKINHCVALIELLSGHLSDKHHIRLEWMIIVLIMVEVGFEVIHYVDRYYSYDNGEAKKAQKQLSLS